MSSYLQIKSVTTLTMAMAAACHQPYKASKMPIRAIRPKIRQPQHYTCWWMQQWQQWLQQRATTIEYMWHGWRTRWEQGGGDENENELVLAVERGKSNLTKFQFWNSWECHRNPNLANILSYRNLTKCTGLKASLFLPGTTSDEYALFFQSFAKRDGKCLKKWGIRMYFLNLLS